MCPERQTSPLGSVNCVARVKSAVIIDFRIEISKPDFEAKEHDFLKMVSKVGQIDLAGAIITDVQLSERSSRRLQSQSTKVLVELTAADDSQAKNIHYRLEYFSEEGLWNASGFASVIEMESARIVNPERHFAAELIAVATVGGLVGFLMIAIIFRAVATRCGGCANEVGCEEDGQTMAVSDDPKPRTVQVSGSNSTRSPSGHTSGHRPPLDQGWAGADPVRLEPPFKDTPSPGAPPQPVASPAHIPNQAESGTTSSEPTAVVGAAVNADFHNLPNQVVEPGAAQNLLKPGSGAAADGFQEPHNLLPQVSTIASPIVISSPRVRHNSAAQFEATVPCSETASQMSVQQHQGWKNFDNICFVNAAVQCVAHCAGFPTQVPALPSGDLTSDNAKAYVAHYCMQVLQCLELGQIGELHLDNLIRSLQYVCPDDFQKDSQLDAHDALLWLLRCTTEIQEFGILIQETLWCPQDGCGFDSKGDVEQHWSLTLEVPHYDTSLEACLKKFFVTEKVLSQCARCKGARRHIMTDQSMGHHQVHCISSPAFVIIHLKRFSITPAGQNVPNRYSVSFPSELLDFDALSNHTETTSMVYDLVSVIQHIPSGSSPGGHYITLARKDVHLPWNRFDDSAVHAAEDRDFCQKGAYVLIYKRSDTVPALQVHQQHGASWRATSAVDTGGPATGYNLALDDVHTSGHSVETDKSSVIFSSPPPRKAWASVLGSADEHSIDSTRSVAHPRQSPSEKLSIDEYEGGNSLETPNEAHAAHIGHDMVVDDVDDVEDNIVEISHETDVSRTLRELSSEGENASKVEEACKKLADLAQNKRDAAEIKDSGGIELIIKALYAHKHVAGVQEQGCKAISRFNKHWPHVCDVWLKAAHQE